MQIKTDREGAVVIRELCDIALKQGGLQSMAGITRVLTCLDHPDKPRNPVPEPGPENPTIVPVPKKRQKRGKIKK